MEVEDQDGRPQIAGIIRRGRRYIYIFQTFPNLSSEFFLYLYQIKKYEIIDKYNKHS